MNLMGGSALTQRRAFDVLPMWNTSSFLQPPIKPSDCRPTLSVTARSSFIAAMRNGSAKASPLRLQAVGVEGHVELATTNQNREDN
jgi:hypothetical protein